MQNITSYANNVSNELKKLSTPAKADACRYYFPAGIVCIGVNATDIKLIIKSVHTRYDALDAENTLRLSEYMLKHAVYHEEKLVAFGLVNKYVKKHYDDALLIRFQYWLENYTTNWAQVDDLCIKTIYQFLMARPHLIEETQHWAFSNVAWCRRASNVVWVKFVKRKIGHTIYYLNCDLVFKQCDVLLNDKDEFVQKSIGWLLKACSQQHEKKLVKYLEKNYKDMPRATLRYAIEKMPTQTRKRLLALH